MKNIAIGDYVLATKYSDGDPRDHLFEGKSLWWHLANIRGETSDE